MADYGDTRPFQMTWVETRKDIMGQSQTLEYKHTTPNDIDYELTAVVWNDDGMYLVTITDWNGEAYKDSYHQSLESAIAKADDIINTHTMDERNND